MRLLGACVAAACVLVQGCAMELVRTPAALSPVSTGESLRLASPVALEFESANRELRAGTELLVVGSLPQGRVLKTRQAFTIAGRHTHEAYLVERDGVLVGFYLPAEGAFSPYSHPLQLSLERSVRP